MPNWCNNEVTVEVDETENLKELKRFITKAKVNTKAHKSALSLNKLVPMPKALKGTTSPQDKPNWYDWSTANWGTKWDVDAVVIETDKHKIVYRFESAWAPPTVAFREIAKKFPSLVFELRYDEPGVQFSGVALFHGEETSYY
jgi:hypothetical protein